MNKVENKSPECKYYAGDFIGKDNTTFRRCNCISFYNCPYDTAVERQQCPKFKVEMNKNMTRQEANRKILERIAHIVEREPDWRFHQILQNIGIEDRDRDQWYDESVETLKNIDQSIPRIPGKCDKNDQGESCTLKNSLNKKMNATSAKYKLGDYVLDQITEERKAEIIEVTATHYVLRDCDDGWQHSVLHDMIENNYKVEVGYHGPIVN